MKRFLTIAIAIAGILFFSACSGTSTAPTVPTGLTNDTIHQATQSWTVTADNGETMSFTVGSIALAIKEANLLFGIRTAQVVFPGSDMSAEDLRNYFCAALVYTNFQKAYQCPVYQIFRPAWNQLSDAQMYAFVPMVEAYGVDIPNINPFTPPCGSW